MVIAEEGCRCWQLRDDDRGPPATIHIPQQPGLPVPSAAPSPSGPSPVLVFDGGCPFCRHFAELSELRGGIPGLVIRDGRADEALRQSLSARGYPLRDGAVLLAGDDVLHGAAAIGWISGRMRPSGPLLRLLGHLFAAPRRAERLYPLLLAARRLALAWRGLPADPDRPSVRG
jgi:predicted DCC family thiol-disulfide oxidoreductase YuxK